LNVSAMTHVDVTGLPYNILGNGSLKEDVKAGSVLSFSASDVSTVEN